MVSTRTRHRPAHPESKQMQTAGEWVDRWARAGLGCRGLIYLLIAWLTVQVARGHQGRKVDEKGALQAVAARPFGVVAVVAVALGLAGLAVWQASIAARPDPGPPRRVFAGLKAFVYTGLMISAVSVVVHRHAGGHRKGWSAQVLAHGWGRALLGAGGIVIAVAAVVLFAKAVSRRYDVDVDFRGNELLEWLGAVAMACRAVIIGTVGGFVIDAAVTYDPSKANGLDGALRSLAREPHGRLLLLVVAGGMALFGVFSCLEVKFART
jgi:heme/copper-type cytochrome/quinol oxidase subunit 2